MSTDYGLPGLIRCTIPNATEVLDLNLMIHTVGQSNKAQVTMVDCQPKADQGTFGDGITARDKVDESPQNGTLHIVKNAAFRI